MTKTIWKSKTFWFNAISGLLTLVTALQPIVQELAVIGLNPALAAQIQSALLITNVAGNLALRFMTNKGVTLT